MTLHDPQIVLGGSTVDLLDLDDSLDRISSHLSAPDSPPLAVTSINLDHVHHFGAGADWTGTLDADRPLPGSGPGDLDWLHLIDGAPLAAQARRLTGRAWPRLAGSDLIGPILTLCERRGTRIGFLGGASSTHSQVLTELAARYPGLQISGCWAPSRDELRDPARSEEIAREVRDARTELLIVGLGKPRQELWIAEHGLSTGSRVLLAFGAVVDFLAGRVARAPDWVAGHGLEWAWRLALEPRRLFARYLVHGPRAYLAVRRTGTAAPGPAPVAGPGIVGVHPAGSGAEPRFAGPDEPADVAVLVVARAGSDPGPLVSALRAECRDLTLRCVVARTGPSPRSAARAGNDVIDLPAVAERGHAATINAARAHTGAADAVLVLDGDAAVERGGVKAMVDRMNRVGAGAVMPRLLFTDGSARWHLRKEPSVGRALLGTAASETGAGHGGRFDPVDTDPESYEHAHQVRWGIDCCLLVRREIDELVGDRDVRFSTATDESDYFLRVRNTGATIWYEPAARIRSEPRSDTRTPGLAALLAANRVRFTRRYRSPGYALAFRTALAVTAARHLTDPAYRRILRTLLGGTARATPPGDLVSPGATGAPDPESWAPWSMPAGAIIIPAHNEEATIARTLARIAPLAAKNQTEIIVVCNGCSDATAAIARRFPGVVVHDIDQASKTAALNVGDDVATGWPRLYLDADIGIEPETVRAVFESLSTGRVLAARPRCVYDTAGASALVKSYYRARGRIPTNGAAIWGAGAYAVNEAGHDRFGRFPAVTADDSYVDSLFGPDEKTVVPDGSPVRVYTPRSVWGLIAVLARQYRGVTELDTASTTTGSIRALILSVRGPASAADALCYGLLTAGGRLKCHRSRQQGRPGWERDLSSRVVPPDLAA